jgi:hypothetical protein
MVTGVLIYVYSKTEIRAGVIGTSKREVIP